jgi:hypothetical protein
MTPWHCTREHKLLSASSPPTSLALNKRKPNSPDEMLCSPCVATPVAKKPKLPSMDSVVGMNDHPHVLIGNLSKKSVLRHFCNIFKCKKKNSTIYGCIICKKGFHVNCFAAYHYAGALVGAQKFFGRYDHQFQTRELSWL